jgi:hypothetical protein
MGDKAKNRLRQKMPAQIQIVTDFRFIPTSLFYRQLLSPPLAVAREVAKHYHKASQRPREIKIDSFPRLSCLKAPLAGGGRETEERPDFRPALRYENKQRKSSF